MYSDVHFEQPNKIYLKYFRFVLTALSIKYIYISNSYSWVIKFDTFKEYKIIRTEMMVIKKFWSQELFG